MRIAILTQYYLPETGAPQNRLHSLARNIVDAGHEVEVITAMPNYPAMRVFDGYRRRLSLTEEIDGIRVRRSWIFVSRSAAMLPRLVNYMSFVITSLFNGLRLRRYDYVVCESPPLFLGISAVLLAWKWRARLVFNVSDLWPESAEKLGMVGDGLALRMAYRLEAWLYRKSHLVTGQTQGIVRDIEARFPAVPVTWLPNGVDGDVLDGVCRDEDWRRKYKLESRKVFMYAGILGHAQGLDVVIRAAAEYKDLEDIAFVIVGDGPLGDDLQELARELGAPVTFIPSVPKKKVLSMIADAYAYIVPLKRLDLFKGAIPSKIFDPLPLGVPILLGVEGEAYDLFIQEGRAGLFFEPENVAELSAAIGKIINNKPLRDELGQNGKAYVQQHFDRRVIAAEFLQKLEDRAHE